jgi:hypothetical protein
MLRSTLLVCAAVIAAASFACAPSPPSSAAPLIACNAASFVSKVSYLTTDFQPKPGASLPTTGPIPAPGPGVPDYAGDLTKVFNAASPAFRSTLCTLDAVFINAVPCATATDCIEQSWGWWQSKRTTPHGRVVALSADLWRTSYSQYETDILESLLPASGLAYANAQSCSWAGVCQTIDMPTTALLAALAHEVGHIGWYVVVNPLAEPTTFCNGNFFGGSWVAPVHRPPPWRTLLTPAERARLRRTGNWRDAHKSPPQIDQIDNFSPGDPSARPLIFALLDATQPWASLFAAMAPDEDFVETYKFEVLTTANPPLTSVTITLPGGGTANLAVNYLAGDKHELGNKVSCVPVSF